MFGHFQHSLDASTLRSDVISSMKILSSFRFWGLGSAFRVPDFGFRGREAGRSPVSSFGLQVPGFGFRISGPKGQRGIGRTVELFDEAEPRLPETPMPDAVLGRALSGPEYITCSCSRMLGFIACACRHLSRSV